VPRFGRWIALVCLAAVLLGALTLHLPGGWFVALAPVLFAIALVVVPVVRAGAEAAYVSEPFLPFLASRPPPVV